MGAFLSSTSLAILRHLKANGRCSIEDLRTAKVADKYKDIHRLYESNFIFPKGQKNRLTTYDITAKGVKCLAQNGVTTGLNERPDAVYVRPADATPSRTYVNASVSEIYQPGQGQARQGLAVWSA